MILSKTKTIFRYLNFYFLVLSLFFLSGCATPMPASGFDEKHLDNLKKLIKEKPFCYREGLSEQWKSRYSSTPDTLHTKKPHLNWVYFDNSIDDFLWNHSRVMYRLYTEPNYKPDSSEYIGNGEIWRFHSNQKWIVNIHNVDNGKIILSKGLASYDDNKGRESNIVLTCRNLVVDYQNYVPSKVLFFKDSVKSEDELDNDLHEVLDHSLPSEKLGDIEKIVEQGVFISKEHIARTLGFKSYISAYKNTSYPPDYRAFRYLLENSGDLNLKEILGLKADSDGKIPKHHPAIFRIFRDPGYTNLWPHNLASQLSFAKYFIKEEWFNSILYELLINNDLSKINKKTLDYFIDYIESTSPRYEETLNLYLKSININPNYYKERFINYALKNKNKNDSELLNDVLYMFHIANTSHVKKFRSCSYIKPRYDLVFSSEPMLKSLLDSGYEPNELTICMYRQLRNLSVSGNDYLDKNPEKMNALRSLIVMFDEYGLDQKNKTLELRDSLADKVKLGDTRGANFYLNKGAIADETILLASVKNDMIEVSKFIIDQGFYFDTHKVARADIDNDDGLIIEYMIQKGILGKEGLNKLAFYAAEKKSVEPLKLIFGYGASMSTVMDMAFDKNDPKVIAFVSENSSSVEKTRYKEYLDNKEEAKKRYELERQERMRKYAIAQKEEAERVQKDYSRPKSIGERVCAYGTQLLFFSVKVVGFVEGKSGKNIQVRIHNTGGYTGDRYKEGSVIWEPYWDWRSCE